MEKIGLSQVSVRRLCFADLQHPEQLTHRAGTHTMVEVDSVSDL
jgi:hypothetical protein